MENPALGGASENRAGRLDASDYTARNLHSQQTCAEDPPGAVADDAYLDGLRAQILAIRLRAEELRQIGRWREFSAGRTRRPPLTRAQQRIADSVILDETRREQLVRAWNGAMERDRRDLIQVVTQEVIR